MGTVFPTATGEVGFLTRIAAKNINTNICRVDHDLPTVMNKKNSNGIKLPQVPQNHIHACTILNINCPP